MQEQREGTGRRRWNATASGEQVCTSGKKRKIKHVRGGRSALTAGQRIVKQRKREIGVRIFLVAGRKFNSRMWNSSYRIGFGRNSADGRQVVYCTQVDERLERVPCPWFLQNICPLPRYSKTGRPYILKNGVSCSHHTYRLRANKLILFQSCNVIHRIHIKGSCRVWMWNLGYVRGSIQAHGLCSKSLLRPLPVSQDLFELSDSTH